MWSTGGAALSPPRTVLEKTGAGVCECAMGAQIAGKEGAALPNQHTKAKEQEVARAKNKGKAQAKDEAAGATAKAAGAR